MDPENVKHFVDQVHEISQDIILKEKNNASSPIN
jgi:hypothetical protein